MKKIVIKSDRHAAMVAAKIEKELRAEFDFLDGVEVKREKYGPYHTIKCCNRNYHSAGYLTSTFVLTAIEYVEKIKYSDAENSGIFWNIETDQYKGEANPVFVVHVWYKHEVK